MANFTPPYYGTRQLHFFSFYLQHVSVRKFPFTFSLIVGPQFSPGHAPQFLASLVSSCSPPPTLHSFLPTDGQNSPPSTWSIPVSVACDFSAPKLLNAAWQQLHTHIKSTLIFTCSWTLGTSCMGCDTCAIFGPRVWGSRQVWNLWIPMQGHSATGWAPLWSPPADHSIYITLSCLPKPSFRVIQVLDAYTFTQTPPNHPHTSMTQAIHPSPGSHSPSLWIAVSIRWTPLCPLSSVVKPHLLPKTLQSL